MYKFYSLVIKADGTNCEVETSFILKNVGFKNEILTVGEIIKDLKILEKFSFIVFPGGFSYGDYTGSGRIVSSIIKHHLLQNFQKHIKDGKLILGICNGFQILVKSGLLPNTSGNWQQEVSLIFNDSFHYEDRWVKLLVNKNTIFTKNLPDYIYLPVAHGEGKFIHSFVKEKIEKLGAFFYVDEKGKKSMDYPQNPNGSFDSVAGIVDETGKILGMMPHPERFRDKKQFYHDEKIDPYGIIIFENVYRYIKEEL